MFNNDEGAYEILVHYLNSMSLTSDVNARKYLFALFPFRPDGRNHFSIDRCWDVTDKPVWSWMAALIMGIF